MTCKVSAGQPSSLKRHRFEVRFDYFDVDFRRIKVWIALRNYVRCTEWLCMDLVRTFCYSFAAIRPHSGVTDSFMAASGKNTHICGWYLLSILDQFICVGNYIWHKNLLCKLNKLSEAFGIPVDLNNEKLWNCTWWIEPITLTSLLHSFSLCV